MSTLYLQAGCTVLKITSYHGHVRCVELLITAGAAVDVQNKVFHALSIYRLFECLSFCTVWFQVTNASESTPLVRDRIFHLDSVDSLLEASFYAAMTTVDSTQQLLRSTQSYSVVNKIEQVAQLKHACVNK